MKNMDLPMFALIASSCLGFLSYAFWCSGFTVLFH